MLHQPVVVLVSLRSSVCSWSVWQARLSHPLNLTLWNLQTSCRGTIFHNLPTNTPRVPQCSWCSPVGTYPLPHAFLHFPALRGQQRRVGVWASAFWQRCRIRRPRLVTGGQAERAGVTLRLLQGSGTVQSSVIFGRRITLCHEMDLLILLCVRVCVCVRLRAPIWSLSTVAVSRVRAAFRDGGPAWGQPGRLCTLVFVWLILEQFLLRVSVTVGLFLSAI